MAAIAKNFGAKIIKNVGDCLILCYPRTSDTSDNITMIEARNTINLCMRKDCLLSATELVLIMVE